MNRIMSTKHNRVLALVLTIAAMMTGQQAWAQDPATIGSICYNAGISAYEISSVANLKDLATYVNGTGSYTTGGNAETTVHDCTGMTFKVTDDIAFDYQTAWNDDTSTEHNFEGIGYDVDSYRDFCGTFDGGGHTISGIRIYRPTIKYVGLFGPIGLNGNATVKDIVLADARITGNHAVGGIVGINRKNESYSGTVSGCTVASNVTICGYGYKNGTAAQVGGIVGYNRGSVTGCTSSALFTTNDTNYATLFGGVAGQNSGSITNCHAYGCFLPEDNISGAIVGRNDQGATLSSNTYHSCVMGTNSFNIGAGEIYMVNGFSEYPMDFNSNNDHGAVLDNTTELWLFANRDNKKLISGYKSGGSAAGISNLNITLKGITLYRDGSWNTLCLPFNFSAFNGSVGDPANLMQLDYGSDGSTYTDNCVLTVKFKKATSINVGSPYLIRWPNKTDITDPTFNNVSLDKLSTAEAGKDSWHYATQGSWKMLYIKSIYAPVAPADGNLFDAHNPDGDAFHCYMTISDPVRDGYTFTGWNTAADGSGTDVTRIMPLTAGTNPNFTLYAQWAENSLSLTANTATGIDGNWTTFYNSRAGYKASAGTTVYKAALNGSGSVDLTPIEGGNIPKGNAVILKSTTSPITLTISSDDTGDYTGNQLQGTDVEIANPGNAYVLSYKASHGLGFYKYIGTNLGAHKAYLTVGSNAPEFFGFEETTDIVPIHNSQFIIHNEADAIYNLAGQRLNKPQKGINIINGRKVVIK